MKSFYELSLIAEEHIYREDLASFASAIWSKVGQSVPGNTPEEKAELSLDTINTALDAAGIVDPSGAADGVNAVIHVLRAAGSKDPDFRNKQLFNALISAVSAVPFGDLAKLLKARKMGRAGAAVRKFGGKYGAQAKGVINTRYATNQANLMQRWAAPAGIPAGGEGAPAGTPAPAAF